MIKGPTCNNSGTEFLIPGVPEFIKDIDEASGIIKVTLIEGMIGEQK